LSVGLFISCFALPVKKPAGQALFAILLGWRGRGGGEAGD
jgi:hypothetical protein